MNLSGTPNGRPEHIDVRPGGIGQFHYRCEHAERAASETLTPLSLAVCEEFVGADRSVRDRSGESAQGQT